MYDAQVRRAADRPLHAPAGVRGIEERRRSARRRSDLELLDALPVGVLLLDAAGTILLGNPMAQQVFGSPAPLHGRSLFDPAFAPVGPDGRPLPEAEWPFERAVRNGVPVRDVVLGLRRPDGARVWLLETAHPLHNDAGTVTQVILTFMDITDRQQAEEALRRGESRWRALIAAAPIGICTSDARGRIGAVNDAYCALLGYAPEELIGREVLCLHPAEQREALRAEFDRRWRADVCEPREYTLLTKGGERRTILCKGVTVAGPEGQPERLCFVVDITGRVQMEEDLRQANAELEKASRAKSEFLATMSHEIRTPLNGVIGLTSLLQSTALSPRQREYVGGIQASGEALLGLINDILDFSKIEAGQLSLERQPFDLGHLIGEVVDQFRGQARAKGLELSAHVDPAVPPLVLGDVGRLRQVLLNLVGNALKFTAQGAVGVQVGVVEESAEGVLLRITVRDTGIGIAPEAQARLFEPFTQADAATTRRYGGTGLGLAIAKRLVERMDGEIGVESALGQGSTFWVQLPLARAAAGVVPPAVRMQLGPVAPAPEVAESGTRGHILVAEDNAINRLVVVGLLQGLGYAVETAENGRQAAEAVGRGHYDLVLMDLHMPELDGFAATAAIRRDEAAEGKGRRVPIVALTADALPGDAEKSLVAGMDDHLTKPITPKRLATVVERWVKSGTVSE